MPLAFLRRLGVSLLRWRIGAKGHPTPPVPTRPPLSRRERGAAERIAVHKRHGPPHKPHPEAAQQAAAPSVPADVPVVPGKVRFVDLPLPPPIQRAVRDLGFLYCTPVQEKALAHLEQQPNLAGKAQTGTGKTAAFLILMFSRFLKRPRAESPPATPRALVLAPTRELVIQIVADAHALARHTSLRCVAVYGGMDFEKQRVELQNGPLDLVAATPGRLLDFKTRGMLDLSKVEVLVLDEADRMLDMGFIPDVRRIIRCLPPRERRQTMLFSATLTAEVRRLAEQWMVSPVEIEVEPEQVAVDTVDQKVYVVSGRDKFTLLYNVLRLPECERVLVFTNRRDGAERLAGRLQRHGVACELLSGDVEQKKRLKVLENFRGGQVPVVVATDVAGRGIHVDSITHVVNYDFPYEPEDYVHRIGRTGRAGHRGVALSFACEDESFVIPEIEAFIGKPLKCEVPDGALLAAPPAPARDAGAERRTGDPAAGSRRRPDAYSRGGRPPRRPPGYGRR